MRIISRSRLREFWESPAGQGSETPLLSWHQIVRNADWHNFAEVKATYGHAADIVGDCVVFDIGNNRWRLIARLRYRTHIVYVLSIMTHKVYDRGDWKRECGCFVDPPRALDNLRKRPTKKRSAARKKEV